MYPPSPQYSSLPTDASDLDSELIHPQGSLRMRIRTSLRGRRRLFRAAAVASIFLVFLVLFKQVLHHTSRTPLLPEEEEAVQWSPGDLTFANAVKPQYLDKPSVSALRPLTIRLAIVSRVDELETRQALRDTMLEGVPKKDVNIAYRFFVGKMKDGDERMTWNLWWELLWERWVRGDVVTLWDLDDVKHRLSEKRYRALKWVCILAPKF